MKKEMKSRGGTGESSVPLPRIYFLAPLFTSHAPLPTIRTPGTGYTPRSWAIKIRHYNTCMLCSEAGQVSASILLIVIFT